MKNIHTVIDRFLPKKFALAALLAAGFGLAACTDELPGVGSIPDLTPPKAEFSYKASISDFREVRFSNLSASSTTYTWDFGDGNTSSEKNPVYIFKAGEGTFPVSLTVADGNNVTDKFTADVVLVDELVPEFKCPSFECSDRSVWGAFSGSGSPTPPNGSTGAKIESSSHFLDQTITVRPGTKYNLTFSYVSSSKSSSSNADQNCGNLLISDGDDESLVFVQEGVPLSASSSEYQLALYTIQTGENTKSLRFRLTPGDKTGRYDMVQIRKAE